METHKKYPYLPENRQILYVSNDNPFIKQAEEYARLYSLDKTMPTGAVLVKDGSIIALGANGSNYHEVHGCFRVKNNIPTGQGYELCEGCSPDNHAEAKAITAAKELCIDLVDSDIYLWGHYWCCKPCWDKMIAAGIKNVFLLEKSEILFDKNNPNNIVGKQFENK
jgi:deoxycytidylate deaminase